MDYDPILWKMSTLRSHRHVRLLPHDLNAALYRSRVETVIIVETAQFSILTRNLPT